MNRIDVSAIQPNPSKFLSTDHEEDNLAKQDDTYELPEYSIKPLHPTSQSFLADQGSNSKSTNHITKDIPSSKSTRE
jgi:hypothetical protein